MKEKTLVRQKINGVDTEKLFETIENIKKNSQLADFRFSVTNKWITCGHNRTTVTHFYGAGTVNKRDHAFTLDADEPKVLLGTDKGPNPVEYLLTALASCVTSSIVYHAAAKGIKIDEIESTTEGSIDLEGFLGLNKQARPGYKEITMKFKIKADVPDSQLEEILKLGPTFSPVHDTITHAVPVKVELVKNK